MDSNQKKFSAYVFLSTFSRNLIEVFIPVILYKFGYSLKEIIFYYLLVNLISLIISYPCIYFSKKYDNRKLSFIGITAFLMVQVLLNLMIHSTLYLIILSLFFAIYRRGYWISRRFYNLKVLKKEKIATTYSLISIINQIGIIISAYIGSILLDFMSLKILTVIAIVLFLIGMVPLYKLKFEHEKNNEKLEFIKTVKKVPKSDLYLFGSYELINVVKFLFPLYIFIYVNNTYQTIGIVNLITNVALITFTYMYGKKLDNSNRNLIKISIILTVITYVFKANSVGYLLFVISFFEGITTKMYELSINKQFYTLSKKFEYYNYNLIYEVVQNVFRVVVVSILALSNFDIKIMIYIILIFIAFGVILNFKHLNIKDW